MEVKKSWRQTNKFIGFGIGILLILLLVVTVIQGVKVHQNNTGIKVSGGVFYSVNIPYTDINYVKLDDEITCGTRKNGIAFFSYKLGKYSNSEFGSYHLFVNKNVKKFIVIGYGNNKTVVFNGKNEEATMDIYEGLLERLTGMN